MTVPTDLPPAVRDAILDWYATRARSLPFRGTTDPYAILVSEAMAQQTQAARAGEAWTRFMARFPTVEALAAATPGDVLREWQGLGYNRRALGLWRAARRIVEVHDGHVPSDLAALEALPGVGPYTARAVAAIAFGVPVGAVDTNVRRVLGRIVAGAVGVSTPAELQRLADRAVPRDRAGEWTHAVMDIGAMLCRPRRPDCASCPARPWCRHASEAAGEVAATGAVEQAASGTLAGSSTLAAAVAPTPERHVAVIREPAAPFRTTSRWLRGRIVDRLRHAPDGEWVAFDGPIGEHDAVAVERAARSLATDGLVELDDGEPGNVRARLPLA